MRVVTNP